MANLSLHRKFEGLRHRITYIWNESPIRYCVKNLTEKFVVCLLIYVALCLFDFLPLKTIGLVLLAVKLSHMVIAVSWHFIPKAFVPRLDEKAVLITGCDTGFGKELALKLDRKGITVYAGCLFPYGDGATDLKNWCSNKLRILHLDVTRDDHVQDAVKAVRSTLGNKKLWAVVNNAGIIAVGVTEWLTSSVCQKNLEVNTLGTYRVTQAFLPLLRRSEGRVVIVASVVGRISVIGTGPYCMSKHALISFADTLRHEMLTWNVTVHTVEPWLYGTKILEEKLIIQDVQKNWAACPQQVRDEYGEQYLQECMNIFKNIIKYKRPESKSYEVVDAMEHATIGKNPKIRYVPGLVGQFFTGFLHTIPVEILDVLAYKMCPGK